MAKATSVYSYSDIAQYLIDGYYRWTLDQSSVPDESPHKFPVSIITYNIDELSPEQQTYALAAMRAWEDVANIHFVTGDQDALVTFHNTAPLLGPYDIYSTVPHYSFLTGEYKSADIYLPTAAREKYDGSEYQLGWHYYDGEGWLTLGPNVQLYIHEIGHALGLGHAGPI